MASRRLTPKQRLILDVVEGEPFGVDGPLLATRAGTSVHGAHYTAASLVRRGLILRVPDRNQRTRYYRTADAC